jgi:hypothetical protein
LSETMFAWQDTSRSPRERAEMFVEAMTLEQKIAFEYFSVWDYCVQSFVINPGQYTVYVGSSADNTPRTATLTAGSGCDSR